MKIKYILLIVLMISGCSMKRSDTLSDLSQDVAAQETILSGPGVYWVDTAASINHNITELYAATTDEAIKTAYENNADTNAYTDAEKTLLANQSGINTGDMTDAEVKTAYENNSDTNAYTDTEKTKLAGIETLAKDDQNATDVPYDNTASGLSSTNVKAAIDEIVGVSYTLPAIIMAEPDQLAGISDTWPLFFFDSTTFPNGVTVTSINISTDVACVDVLNIEEWINDGTAWTVNSTIDNITLSGISTTETTITDSLVAAGSWVYLDLPATPSNIAFYSVTLTYTKN